MRAIINSDLQYYFGGNTRTNYLSQGQALKPGDQLTSTNGLFSLVYQTDGNLCMYNWLSQPYWSIGINGSPGQAIYQTDGNFCVYDGTGTCVWATMVYGYGNGTLTLQNNGNLVVFESSNNNAVAMIMI